jgi:hypothetical protein
MAVSARYEARSQELVWARLGEQDRRPRDQRQVRQWQFVCGVIGFVSLVLTIFWQRCVK